MNQRTVPFQCPLLNDSCRRGEPSDKVSCSGAIGGLRAWPTLILRRSTLQTYGSWSSTRRSLWQRRRAAGPPSVCTMWRTGCPYPLRRSSMSTATLDAVADAWFLRGLKAMVGPKPADFMEQPEWRRVEFCMLAWFNKLAKHRAVSAQISERQTSAFASASLGSA